MLSDEPVLIDLRGVSVGFIHGALRLPVLERIDLQVVKGRRVGIVGPSGAGKTTLLRTIAGMVAPSEGQVLIGGSQIARPGHKPNFFGMMFQEPALLDWRTVRGNIVLPFELGVLRHVSDAEIERRVLNFLSITGLEQYQSFRPAQLSGGMKQRVSLIRCLITRPTVLLLDEPFGALDPMTRTKLWQEFDRIATIEKITTVLVTHSIEEAAFLCDTVIVLSERPAKILSSTSIYFEEDRDIGLIDSPDFLRCVKEIRQILYTQHATCH